MATPPHRPQLDPFAPVPFTRPTSLPPPPLPPVMDMPPDPPDTENAMDLSNSTVMQPSGLPGSNVPIEGLGPQTLRRARRMGQSGYDDEDENGTAAPPAATSMFREHVLETGPGELATQAAAQQPPRNPEDDEGSEREEGDEEDDDDEDGDGEPEFPWHYIEEDKSAPCDDELKYLESKEEHSALDHAYWEKETFFDLDDPELTPGASGRIDWLLEGFNGTKEKPNKELLLKSPVVKIGGHDWQIKFYPKGNRTEFLSVYLDCVSMQGEGFPEHVDLTNPPLPVQAGSSSLKKRNSLAAQVSVVMYNPSEPRVYESKVDAHQFHKKSSDFGWKYFSRDPRYEFHIRRHGQRQAILRDDKLAFSAYIRLVDDPTGCMWDNGGTSSDVSITTTGLRPFDASSAQIAAIVPLLHLRSFRDILYKYTGESASFTTLQVFLEKLLARRLKRKHLRSSPVPDARDVVEVLRIIRDKLSDEGEQQVAASFDELLTDFLPFSVPVCGSRLLTEGCTSVSEALQRRQRRAYITPPVLTLELERAKFDKSKRKWEKLTGKIGIDDSITYGQEKYQLYAMVAHSGPLGSPNYMPFVRPGGPGTRWYAYEPCQVRCMTQKQAMERVGAIASADTKDEVPGPELHTHAHSPLSPIADRDTVVYLAMYVREDFADYTFALPTYERWDVPPTAKKSQKLSLAKENGDQTGLPPIHDPEKVNEASLGDIPPPPEDINAQIDAYIAQHGELPPIPHPPPPNLMDGDDVVMSDMEDEGSQTPMHVDRAFAATKTTRSQDPPAPKSSSPATDETTHQITVDFFSSEYYSGSALLSGIYHGEGHLITATGDSYTGTFAHGLPHGHGTMTYASSGNVYTGAWSHGKHHGQGVLNEASTGNVFEGGWQEGKKHGKFVLRGEVTDEDKGLCQICYEREMNTAFYDCGHVLVCRTCAGQVDTCPVCRRRVIARLELYGVKVGLE